MVRKLALGEPPDVGGCCNARLRLADNFGDGESTFVCQLLPRHDGLHEERFDSDGPVVVQWTTDEGKEYNDCYCTCGWEDMMKQEEMEAECCHAWKMDECQECGMTRAEHTAIIAERTRKEQGV